MMSMLHEVPTEITVGRIESIPMGEGKRFEIGQHRVAIFRLRDGGLYAVQAQCPHQQGPLEEGITGSCTVICPMHSWKFNLATGACLNDASHCLRTYPVREEGGWLVLTVQD